MFINGAVAADEDGVKHQSWMPDSSAPPLLAMG